MVPQQQRRRRRRAALPRTAEKRVIVARGAGGFGFTIAGQRPCVVSAVAVGGPAERAGLRAGDALLAVDGASVSRAPHAAVARLVAAAPQAISLSVAPRESPPTDTEDTEPDERARTRRRHPPPRRRPQQPPMMHHPGCHAAPSTSTVNEILHNLTRAQLNPSTHAARLECRAVVGYLGTIETPRAASETPPGNVRTAVRRLRQERRPAANVLLSVLPNVLILRRPTGQTLAQYARERIVYAGCSSDADRRYFGLVTAAEMAENETEVSYSCHVFAVDSRLAEHEAHINRAREFQIACTRDPVAERCLEFPPSAEYVVGVIKGMYSLPSDDCSSPALQQLSKLAMKGDSPAMGNFARCNRAALRMPRNLRQPNCRHEDNRIEGQEFVANSPQPSNHSEVTTTSSNSDSGIGFHNDGRNIAERILVVDFAGQQQPINRYRAEVPRRPIGVVGCNFEDGSFLSNTTPVVDGFGGQGRPLNHLDDVMLNPNDLQHLGRYLGNPGRSEEPRPSDTYNYNNVHYSNMPSSSRMLPNGAVYDPVYTEGENQYELIPPQIDDLELERVTEAFNSVEIYEERRHQPESCPSNEAESVENVTVISGTASKASMDSVSVYSSRSHEEARPSRRKHLQASLDDMLVLGLRDEQAKKKNDDDNFVHPASVKCKVRKSKPMNLLAKTKQILTGKRHLSASAGDVCAASSDTSFRASSEPDLTVDQSEQSSPFRRWTTGSGAGSSYRQHDHRNIYNKQMSEGTPPPTIPSNSSNGCGGVSRWSLGLEQLLADPAGAAAFAHFLHNEFAAENIRFWWSCEQYNTCNDEVTRSTLAQQIWSRHLADGAPEPVNVDATARRAAALRLCQQPPAADLFQHAQKQIFNVMKFDSYPRFLRSGVHAECARADLRGLPQPYAPRGSPDNTPNKLKKSASNASERRRSGGASLLPWKLRAVSKDRAQSQSTNNVSASILPEVPQPTSVTDVVKSSNPSGTGAPGCSLCRVVLPDGATSVVGVDAAIPVRRLVDRLLQRRNLLCTSYDVLLRDGNQGETTLVDSQAPSTVLGGREAIVERRCVVRLELCGRCVAVRCRPQRRLRHALKPVLLRYCAQVCEPTVLRDNRTVHMDTLMQELDGARLQILLNEEECPRSNMPHDVPKMADSERERDDDVDSLSELAVRLQDDFDNQSGASSTSRSECGSIGGVTPAGRVKVALRAGASLHHHPPDFLDNLRETQRIRLQNRPDVGGGAAGSGAPPSETRSPPPLPPKPRPSVQAPAIV